VSFQQFVFYFFSVVLIFSAFRVITVRNPVHAVLFLVLTFFTSAAMWILMQAEFLGIVLVLVYVGAVMVLFMFVVMMLDINIAEMREGFIRHLPLGVLVAAIMVIEMVLVVSGDSFKILQMQQAPADFSNTREIGSVLYTDYVYAFEIAAVILLVAIIAAISLTLRRRPGTRYQNPSDQVQVRKEERLRIIKMDAEKK